MLVLTDLYCCAGVTKYRKIQISSSTWSAQTITQKCVRESILCGILCSISNAEICNLWRYQDELCMMTKVTKNILDIQRMKFIHLYCIILYLYKVYCVKEEKSVEAVEVYVDTELDLALIGQDIVCDEGYLEIIINKHYNIHLYKAKT